MPFADGPDQGRLERVPPSADQSGAVPGPLLAAASRSERLPGLDLLRAAAITCVMLHHAAGFGFMAPERWVVRYGWMGVDLFFALSGFLIAGQLFARMARGRKPDYVAFYARRLLRTLPAYFVVVAVSFTFSSVRDQPYIQPLWKFAIFALNIGLTTSPPTTLSHAWSLCVEEQFYIAFPLIVHLMLMRPGRKLAVGIFVCVITAGMFVRGLSWLSAVAEHPYRPGSAPLPGPYMTWIYYPTWTRLDGLAAGVAVAAIREFLPKCWDVFARRPNILLVLAATMIIASFLFFEQQVAMFVPTVFGFPFLSVGMALLVAASSSPRCKIGRYRLPGAEAMAAISYSLYLTHKSAFHLIQVQTAAWPPPYQSLAPVMAGLAAVMTGTALFWLVERPFLKLQARLRNLASPGGKSDGLVGRDTCEWRAE